MQDLRLKRFPDRMFSADSNEISRFEPIKQSIDVRIVSLYGPIAFAFPDISVCLSTFR